MNKQLNSIQTLRAVAVLLVLAAHSTAVLRQRLDPLSSPFSDFFKALGSLGASGVDIFFVISGFIMFYIAKNIFGKTDNRATQQFMWKRLIRVIPLWWFYVTLTLIYKVYYLLKTNSLIETFDLLDWAFIFQSFLLIPSYNEVTESIAPLLLSGWTLSYEVFFYITVACLLRFDSRRALQLLIVFYTMLSVLHSFTNYDSPDIVRFITNPILLEFCFGAVIAYMYTNNIFINNKVCLGLLLLAVLLFVISTQIQFFNDGIHDIRRVVYWGIPSTMLVLGMINLEKNLHKDSLQSLTSIGNASYSIYLSHEIIPLLIGMKIIILINLPAYLNNNLIVVLLIAACIISGIILFHLIEKPLQKWLTKVFDNKWKSKNKRLALANEGRTEKA